MTAAVLALTSEPVDVAVAVAVIVAMTLWVWADHRRPRP